MNTAPKRIITVFGTSAAAENDPVFEISVRLGQLLAGADFEIANGGYGGTMYAVSKGAAGVGGTIYGITCKAFKRGKANAFVTHEVSTANLDQRLKKLIETGDGYIVLPGATGTLLELAWVWEHKNKGFQTVDKPIVVIGSFWKPLIEMMKQMDADCGDCIYTALTPQDAVDYLTRFFAAKKD